MVTEIRINGTFITGSTIDDLEEAKKSSLSLLKERLSRASLLETSDVFQFIIDSVDVEKL